MDNRQIIDYLPPELRKFQELQAIMDGGQYEFDKIWGALRNAIDQSFINTATAYGIGRWENIVGITPSVADTLEDRRFRLQARTNESLPYTMRALKHLLALLCGEDGFEVRLENSTYKIFVKVDLGVKSNYDAVAAILRRVVPANIAIQMTLQYNTHETLAAYTHGQLAAYTHAALKEDVL